MGIALLRGRKVRGAERAWPNRLRCCHIMSVIDGYSSNASMLAAGPVPAYCLDFRSFCCQDFAKSFAKTLRRR